LNILVLNPGSSTLKFAAGSKAGKIERIAADGMRRATSEVLEQFSGTKIDAVGCRVVHGGSRFLEPAVIDDEVIAEIRRLTDLAPLHNPLALDVIEQVRASLPGIPLVAIFDTAFHQTMPEIASTYAVPSEISVRRYGFHGISYSYIAQQLRELGAGPRSIVCHLGNGASVCAMRDGRSVDTSMGLTPLEGLVMGTRSGDLDPGVVLYLMRRGMSERDLDDLLNHRSGLLGISGRTGDVRDLEKAAAEGDARAELALSIFAYRVTKYIGAYAAVLGGLDALVFTAGIGEHSASMRRRICEPLGFLGIEVVETLNQLASDDERCISSGPVQVWVIATNEELEMARAVERLLSSG
jgi:acetate kinase